VSMASISKKQVSDQAEWVTAWLEIEKRVPKHVIDEKIAKTIKEVKSLVAGKRVAFAWSGGKDSIALEFVMRHAGVKECLIGISNLEYPAFLQFVTDAMPPRLEVINAGLDLRWLSENLDMLFPKDSKTASKWFKLIQHNAQDAYFLEHKLDFIILGRRKSDGNHIPYNFGLPIYRNKRGFVRYSPLAEWTHEDVLAIIHWYQLPMPPIYSWPRGYQCGTHSWAARQWTQSDLHGMHEVYTIDPGIVMNASKLIPQARTYIDKYVLKRGR
jgi:3'-phosphoadenosine 5'-phosphosulfate sulfotransferase (PAPS reductase)/FAD synthetase